MHARCCVTHALTAGLLTDTAVEQMLRRTVTQQRTVCIITRQAQTQAPRITKAFHTRTTTAQPASQRLRLLHVVAGHCASVVVAVRVPVRIHA
jgi:hypothetical protein